MKLILSLFLILTIGSSCNSSIKKDEIKTNIYSITFGELEDRNIRVEANIFVQDGKLNMMSRPARFIPDIESWWDIIKIDNIKDEEGQLLKITNISGNSAKLNQNVNGNIKIMYTIDISYIDKNYPNLNTAIGKSFNEGLFIVGKPLFIFGDWKLKTKVKIHQPKAVKITVPWTKIDDKIYAAENLRELILSNVIISNDALRVTDMTIGKLSYSLATFELDKKSTALINQIAKDISKYYVETFPLKQKIRYVQLVYGVSGANGGGEAYPYSSASAISKNNLESSFLWRITVFHELFHMWNSHMLKGVSGSSDMEWFQEGFTDYITELTLSKTKHIDSSYLSNFQKNSLAPLIKTFENNIEKVNIKNSGIDKGKNYIIVYRGGWLIANWLELRLKQETNNIWDIERLFQHLFAKYPINGQNTLSFEAFLAEIETIDRQTAKDLEAILTKNDWLAINTILKK
nr:hypothetical protein [uncultured Psychroserpens sp.]